jgi:hypothetical protein
MKTLVTTVALVAMFASSALAQTATQRARAQRAPAQFEQSYGRDSAASYDGRIEGQPRTCGFFTFQYDPEGTPTGPYCH